MIDEKYSDELLSDEDLDNVTGGTQLEAASLITEFKKVGLMTADKNAGNTTVAEIRAALNVVLSKSNLFLDDDSFTSSNIYLDDSTTNSYSIKNPTDGTQYTFNTAAVIKMIQNYKA